MPTKKRPCNKCDCRDEQIWTAITGIFNPICSTVNGQKPPCAYVAHFGCTYTVNGGSVTQASSAGTPITGVNNGDTYLRPWCSFRNASQYVSITTSGAQNPGANYGTGGCSWLERFPQVNEYLNELINIAWKMDISASTVKLALNTLGLAIEYTCQGAFDPIRKNNFTLTSSQPAIYPYFPNYVCVTPIFQEYSGQVPYHCSNGFEIDLPAISGQFASDGVTPYTINIPAQSLVLNPAIRSDTTYWGIFNYTASAPSVVSARQAYAELTCNPTPQGISTLTLWASGLPTSNANNGKFGIWSGLGLTCDGGILPRTYTPIGSNGNINNPLIVTLQKWKIERSENDSQGKCPTASSFAAGLAYPFGTPMAYDTEPHRCACCDPYCDAMPIVVKLLPTGFGVSGTFPLTAVAQTTRVGVNSPSGPSREATLAIAPHTLRFVAYCSNGTWYCDYYCDTTFLVTTTMISTCCPLTAYDRGVLITCGGNSWQTCIAINTNPVCTAASCCTDATESSCHITLTSTCPTLNGVSIAMTRTSSHRWDGIDTVNDDTSVSMVCSGGVTTITYQRHITFCHFTMTSTNVVCSPVMSGTFAAVSGLSGTSCPCASYTVSATVSP